MPDEDDVKKLRNPNAKVNLPKLNEINGSTTHMSIYLFLSFVHTHQEFRCDNLNAPQQSIPQNMLFKFQFLVTFQIPRRLHEVENLSRIVSLRMFVTFAGPAEQTEAGEDAEQTSKKDSE